MVTELQSMLAPLSRYLPKVVLESGSDAAWAFAIGSFVSLTWPFASAQRTAWLSIGAIVAIGYEIGQLVNIVPGIFDMMDVFTSALAYATAIVIDSKRGSTK